MCSLVSIIITTYKRSDFLERALRSVIGQTYQNIEVIVVDDNDESTEYHNKVVKIVENFQKEDNRIILLSKGKNQGACAARNAGFSISKGKYINFLDDDDEFSSRKIELQVNKFSEVGSIVGAVGCFGIIKDENNRIIMHSYNKKKGDVFFDSMIDLVCQTSLPLFRRDVLEESGGFEDIPSCQDALMQTKYFAVNPYYDYVGEELVTIYHHSGSRISNGQGKIVGALELRKRYKRFYSRLTDEEIERVELALNKNIINACIICGDRRKAMHYFRQRGKLRKKWKEDDIKLFIGIIIGAKIRQHIHIIINTINDRTGIRHRKIADVSN